MSRTLPHIYMSMTKNLVLISFKFDIFRYFGRNFHAGISASDVISASDKAKLFAENFSLNSNLDDSGVSLPVFPSRTNLKLHNISVIQKMVRKVVINLD